MAFTGTAEYLIYLLVLGLGLSVGSFLNVVIYRLPRESLSIAKPARSFCPNCGKDIHWYDNIPVVSWVLLRAKCRSCGQPIAIRYPLVEMAAGILALYLFNRFGLTISFLIYFYFCMCLLAIALIDLELMIIPMHLVYPTIGLGLVCALWEPSLHLTGPALALKLNPTLGPRLTSLAGAVLGLVLGWLSLWLVSTAYKVVRGHEGMGDGDPPLLAMIGAYLGWRSIFIVILWSTLIGLVSVGVLIALSKNKAPEEGWGMKALPFGPFLVLAAFLYLFFGPGFISWYLSLM